MTEPEKELSVYQRVKHAALQGRGIRMTWQECLDLYAGDNSFSDMADAQDHEDEALYIRRQSKQS